MKNSRLDEAKAEMKKRLEYEVVKMDRYCKLRGIDNRMIADNCGLPPNQVWRFRNRHSPEMTMVNFMLVAQGIGYTVKFINPDGY